MAIRRLLDVDVRGKRVFIRADLNVPQDDHGNITDDLRIRASVPAIRDALDRGAAVMVTSHLGRPNEGEWTAAASLAGAGEVLVSRTVADLLAGSDFDFHERGEHELKGLPGSWRLFSVQA